MAFNNCNCNKIFPYEDQNANGPRTCWNFYQSRDHNFVKMFSLQGQDKAKTLRTKACISQEKDELKNILLFSVKQESDLRRRSRLS